MGKYTDDEIRAMPKITAKIAADYLGISPMMVTLGMRNNVLPIGFAIKKEDRYSESWSYNIIPERLIAYNHGRINEVQVQNIEKNLNTIISQFEEMKRDLVFLLKENEELYYVEPNCGDHIRGHGIAHGSDLGYQCPVHFPKAGGSGDQPILPYHRRR